MRIHKITMELDDGREMVFPDGMVRHVEATLERENYMSAGFTRSSKILSEPTVVRVLIELDVPMAYWQVHQEPGQIEQPKLQIGPGD